MTLLDLLDGSNRGDVDELVDQPLAVHLSEDAPLVVVPQGPAHRLVVHVRLVLVRSPQPRHSLAVDQLEHPPWPVQPLDVGRAARWVLQQAQQELPQKGRRRLLGFFSRRN